MKKMKTFDEVFIDKTKYGVKVQTSEYGEQGEHIIIDQGQNQVAGYTDREEGLFEEVPVVIFGDHTRVIKYVACSRRYVSDTYIHRFHRQFIRPVAIAHDDSRLFVYFGIIYIA